jgi:predicted AAA+ superfamily ATPase
MLIRSNYLQALEIATRRSPITARLGPGQVGKTTLARIFTAKQPATFFNLESLPDQRRLQNPELVLRSLQGLVVLDKIQQRPELLSTLRVLVDRSENQTHDDHNRRFVILGSASPQLIRHASELLAGRVEFIDLNGFNLSETGSTAWRFAGMWFFPYPIVKPKLKWLKYKKKYSIFMRYPP